jgi:hypothetical protein
MLLPEYRNVKINLRGTTTAVRTRAAKCIGVDIGIFEHLLRNVTNFYLSVCDEFVFLILT